MTRSTDLVRAGRTQDLWQKYCGFIDLDLDEFMAIQDRLLMEQVRWFGACELGRQIMGPRIPSSVEQFRQVVPYTTYADYAPYLLEKRTDVLPERPLLWIRTSGRSGEYAAKWVPVFERAWRDRAGPSTMAAMVLAAAKRKYDFALEEDDTLLYFMGPPPLGLGCLVHSLLEEFAFELVPPAEEAEALGFEARTRRAFELAMEQGIDTFFGISSILARIGEQFGTSKAARPSLTTLIRPWVLYRLIRGKLRSWLARRPMAPKDLWNVKAILTVGMDTDIYRERIRRYWGVEPLEMYGGTEIWWVAFQTWERKDLCFVPDTCFLEFIPEAEHRRSKLEPAYVPMSVTLRDVKPGEKYEIVVTNFGGVFVRYRVGDMITITALNHEKAGIHIPQMRFFSRCDDVIDLAGFTRLTEKVIWQAIEDAGIPYTDWTVCKEDDPQYKHSILHLYLELSQGGWDRVQVEDRIHECLKLRDDDYRDLEAITGTRALRLTLIPAGTFAVYMQERRAAGVDPAHMKPVHVNPPRDVKERLLSMATSTGA